MLASVERRAARKGLRNVRTLQAAAGEAALPADRYDVALLVTVLGEIPSERRGAAIEELAAALRRLGRPVVVDAMFDPHRQSREPYWGWPAPRACSSSGRIARVADAAAQGRVTGLQDDVGV